MSVDVQRFGPADAEAAQAFFRRIPEGEVTFIKEDVLDPETVSGWSRDERGRRFLAFDEDGEVVGYVAVIPGIGWSSHVGELRLLVDPTQRRRGVGRHLARRALSDALELGLTKIVVEVVAEQSAPIAMFQGLGFEGEGLLRDHVRDRTGRLRDLVILSHLVADTSALMATAGIEDALS